MIQVMVLGQDKFESSMREFKKRVIRSGILQEIKAKTFYLTRAQKRREKERLAKRRLLRRKKRIIKMEKCERTELTLRGRFGNHGCQIL